MGIIGRFDKIDERGRGEVYLHEKKIIAFVLVLSLLVFLLPRNEGKAKMLTKTLSISEEALSSPVVTVGKSTWDCIYYGNYWQNDTNGDGIADTNDSKERIKWRVLSVDGNDAFLMSDQALDFKRNSDNNRSEAWATCYLREWLNSTFYDVAFSKTEKDSIISTTIENDIGGSTIDNVYMLSTSEASNTEYGFDKSFSDESETRIASNTTYCALRDYDAGFQYVKESIPTVWWTRTTGEGYYGISHVSSNGKGYYGGWGDLMPIVCDVRPVIHLDLSSAKWTYAGTISAKNSISSISIPEPSVTQKPVYNEASIVTTTGALYQKAAGMGSIKLTCNEKQFSQSSDVYCHDLAIFAAGMSTMVYNQTAANVTTALHNLGYQNVKNIADSENGKVSPYWIANKTIILDGKKTTIISVFIRGTYNEEWIDNFDSGYGSTTHKGFEYAANFVWAGINDYVIENDLCENNLKILISGHSRGAATANLLGYDLDEYGLYSNRKLTKNDVFVYTFATPNTTKDKNRNKQAYNNIFNIVNPEDFVTKVLPSDWGYGRYGTTYVLPSKTTDFVAVDGYVNYKSYLKKLRSYFSKYRPDDKDGYAPYLFGMTSVSKYVKKLTNTVTDGQSYYTKDLYTHLNLGDKSCMRSLKSLFTYTLGCFMSNNSKYEKISYAAMADASLGYWGSTGKDTIGFFVVHQAVGSAVPVLTASFACAHMPETYLSAMNVLSEIQLKKKRMVKLGIVNCPVDVNIKNADETSVGEIVNNQVVEATEDDVQLSVDKDSKVFYLPINADYTVELTGNDTGTMDYSLCELDPDTGEIGRSYYEKVPVKRNVTYTQNVTSESDLSSNNLVDDNNALIKPREILGKDDLGSLSVDVIVEGVGSANSMMNLTQGEYVTLCANTDSNNSFLGWYDMDDNFVSSESEFSFSINESLKYKAKFTDNIVAVEKLNYSGNHITLQKGETIEKPAIISPANATNKWINYTSSNSSVVEADVYGMLTGVNNGEAIITAKAEDGKAIAELKVTVTDSSGNNLVNILTPTQTPTNKKSNDNMHKNKTKTTKVKKPKGVKGFSVKYKKKLTVSWKKLSSISGYQIQCALNKKFIKKKKNYFVGSGTKKKIVKGLKKKKTYYFRIRAYKSVFGKKVYGAWSQVKKCKIRGK